MGKVVYVSGTPRLTVALKKTFADGKPWSPRIQRFDDNGYLAIDENQEHGEKIIDLLDNDIRYGVEFRRLTQDEHNIIADVEQSGVAHSPVGGMDEEVVQKLLYLQDKLDKDKMVATELKKVYNTLVEVIHVFQIHGVRKPKVEDSPRRFKSLIMEILEILEECDIYPER